MIASYLKGFTLCLSPLLSLAANQVNKLVITNTRGADSIIIALHMDESEHSDVTEILGMPKKLQDTSTLTVAAATVTIAVVATAAVS